MNHTAGMRCIFDIFPRFDNRRGFFSPAALTRVLTRPVTQDVGQVTVLLAFNTKSRNP